MAATRILHAKLVKMIDHYHKLIEDCTQILAQNVKVSDQYEQLKSRISVGWCCYLNDRKLPTSRYRKLSCDQLKEDIADKRPLEAAYRLLTRNLHYVVYRDVKVLVERGVLHNEHYNLADPDDLLVYRLSQIQAIVREMRTVNTRKHYPDYYQLYHNFTLCYDGPSVAKRPTSRCVVGLGVVM